MNEINNGQSIELLKELHILTRDGVLNQDSRRKLKQVNHLCQFIEPLIKKTREEVVIVDHGAGKSYLGFILFDLFIKGKKPLARVFGIENRPELIAKSMALSNRLGFTQMNFLNLTVSESIQSNKIPEQVDIVTALHACDTATDDAIEFALKKKSKYIVLVPCCQAEIAAIFRKNKNKNLGRFALTEIWRHPIHTREFGSHITNVLRCLQLEAHGYQVMVTELVGWEHSLKNELIVAELKNAPSEKILAKIESIIIELGIEEKMEKFARFKS